MLITWVITASIELEYHPNQWRSAKVVRLRKPRKPDYPAPGAYFPISLLNMLGKLFEVAHLSTPITPQGAWPVAGQAIRSKCVYTELPQVETNLEPLRCLPCPITACVVKMPT